MNQKYNFGFRFNQMLLRYWSNFGGFARFRSGLYCLHFGEICCLCLQGLY